MAADALILYDYWRSSAAYRVRIALNLKGLVYEQRSVHLVRDGGEQNRAAYLKINPQGLVPALVVDGQTLTQSLSICEYVDEVFDGPRLLPRDPYQRARVRSLAQTIACDVHPLNNLRVQNYLKSEWDVSPKASVRWMNYWMGKGFKAIETSLAGSEWYKGKYCFGDSPTLADIVLIPQVYNAERFGCDLTEFPRIQEIAAHCRGLAAFELAAPENQPDAPG